MPPKLLDGACVLRWRRTCLQEQKNASGREASSGPAPCPVAGLRAPRAQGRPLEATFYPQPFDPQGSPQTLGKRLVTEILSGPYKDLKVLVAFASSSGTSRLYGPLRDFVAAGGQVEIHVGIANDFTSMQAVEHLLAAGTRVFAFDTGDTVTFHPKVYLLQGNGLAWASVGSSNLTAEGLYRNFEANTIIELDPSKEADADYLEELLSWFTALRGYPGNCFELKKADLPALVTTGLLIDERLKQRPQRLVPRRDGRGRVKRRTPPIKVPSAPPPHPELAGSRSRIARRSGVAKPTIFLAPAASQAQHFAMTLSAFDCSHRTGVPGTPEVALPEDIVGFFPRVSRQGRMYPDAYFDTILNKPNGPAEVVNVRIWRRPPGAGTGHADWRLNVGHKIVDLTAAAGGDILFFERLPAGSQPPYEVWVVGAGTPQHGALLARCTKQVQAAGTAGTKRYGLF